MYPTAWNAIFQAFWSYLPESILERVRHIPTREYARIKYTVDIFNKYSKRLIAQKSAAMASDIRNKDVMSVLGERSTPGNSWQYSGVTLLTLWAVRANASEDPRSKLSEEEMVSQMSAFTLAGHETTANTITWMLWELSKHPDYQDKMRAEIRQKRTEATARGDADFTIEDLESMEYLQAAIKVRCVYQTVHHTLMRDIQETLRFHPIAYHLNRVASQDDIIPLAYPIVSAKGEVITEIPISKGQEIMPNIAAYNRYAPSALPH